MDASVKHRIIGSILVISIALVISPFFLKERKPAWMVMEDKKSFHIPTAPKQISVTLLKHKEIKKSEISKLSIPDNPIIQKQVKIAELSMTTQKKQLMNQSNLAKLNHYKSKHASVRKFKTKGKKDVSGLIKEVNKEQSKTVYSVQLVTFSNATWAKKLLSKLKKQGVDAYLKDLKSKSGKQYTLVMAGHLSSKSKAKELQKKLDTMINVKSIIIKHT